MSMGISPEEKQYVVWCRRMFSLMADGALWGIPRSGLIFTRRGDTLVLTGVMPHDMTLPLSAPRLIKQQRSDFNEVQKWFGLAGITVTRDCEIGEEDWQT